MTRPFHPILFAAFPILFLFRQNIWGLTIGELAVPFSATLVAVTAVQVSLGRLSRQPRKVGVILASTALLFFSYGHVWKFMGQGTRTFGVDRDLVLGSAWATITVFAAWFTVRTKRRLLDFTKVLNIVAITLVFSVLAPIGKELYLKHTVPSSKPGDDLIRLSAGRSRTDRPDIYYLIFDRYAGQQTLENVFKFDNGEFLGFLERRGFVVAPHAMANYRSTALSLATSLNLQYLDWASKGYAGRTTSREPIYDAVRTHLVGRSLQKLGYHYIHIGSRYDVTRESPIADVNDSVDKVSEFTRVLYESTALLPFARRRIAGPPPNELETFSRDMIEHQLEATVRAQRLRGPKFVFVHFLLPHTPYIYDRKGNPVDSQPRGYEARSRAYLEQLLYTNVRIEQLVDALLSGPPERSPVIILQSDEGPYPDFSRHLPAEAFSRDDETLRVKYRILMAMRLPGVAREAVYPTITPVNAFRVAFNAYFRAGLPLLQDEGYISFNDDYYRFIRITDRLREPGD